MRDMSLLIAVVGALVGCSPAQTSNESQAEDSNGSRYFDLSTCWTPADRTGFRGAIAIFGSPAGDLAVIYSGLCSVGTNLNNVENASKIRVLCIDGIPPLRHCRNNPASDLNPRFLEPPLRSEFPSQLYAIRGRLVPLDSSRNTAYVFRKLDVEKYQKIPKEMFGAFLYHPDERPLIVKEYLQDGPFTGEGYHIVK